MLTFRRTSAALVISALSALALTGCGSDDSGDSDFEQTAQDSGDSDFEQTAQDSGSSAESSSDSTGHGGEAPEDVVSGDIHSSGEEVEFTVGKQYDYGDGRVEFGSDAEKFAVSVSDFRKVDVLSSPDPNAPADHPSAQGERVDSMLCYDVKVRMIHPLMESGGVRPLNIDAVFHNRILWDGKTNGDKLKSGDTSTHGMVPPGETVLNDETRAARGTINDRAEHSMTYANCYSMDMKNAENTSGEIPDGMDGIILTLKPRLGSDPREPNEASWRLDLEK